jgi:hypothetical protein
VPEHAHDWPVVSLFVMGSYLNETDVGKTFISGPSAVFYRAGAAHRNTTAALGFEQIEIEFDPNWLGRGLVPTLPVVRWEVVPGGRRGTSLTLAKRRHQKNAFAQRCNGSWKLQAGTPGVSLRAGLARSTDACAKTRP